MLCPPRLQGTSWRHRIIIGWVRAVRMMLRGITANLETATREAGGPGQRPVELDGTATLCHVIVTTTSKFRAGRLGVAMETPCSHLPHDRCGDLSADRSSRSRSYTSVYSHVDKHVYKQQKEVW
jgi:hypothetical protein